MSVNSRWQFYPVYKDSGLDWLGEIPAHWETRRLKYAAPESGSKLNEKPGELPYLGLENIESNTGRLLLDDPTEEVESTVVVFKKGDVLFGKLRPYLAKVVHASFDGVGTTELLVLRPKDDVDSQFLFYHLLADGFIDTVNSLTYGTKMPRANSEQVGNLVVGLPPLPEQRAITTFLDCETARLDALVAKQEQLIELLQEKRAALISHAVTKGLDPTVPMKDSGIPAVGQIPVHWGITQFKYVAEISYGLTLQLDRTLMEGTPIISMPNITKEGQLLLDDVPMAPALTAAEKTRLLLRKGDLLFNWRSGSPEHVGKTAYFDAEGEYTHVSFLLRIRTDPERQESRYYQMYINSLRNMGFFGSSKDQVNKTYNQTELQRLEVIVPTLDEQRAIAAFLNRETAKLDALIAKVQALIERLQEYRTALISAAVTGKIDVRGEQLAQRTSQVQSGGQE